MIRLKHISLPPAERLALLLRAHGIPFEREFAFATGLGRKWRADFRIGKVLIEVEGLLWQGGGGRHQRAKGFAQDIEKYEAARSLGYQVVRCTPDSIDAGDALRWILTALERVT